MRLKGFWMGWKYLVSQRLHTLLLIIWHVANDILFYHTGWELFLNAHVMNEGSSVVLAFQGC